MNSGKTMSLEDMEVLYMSLTPDSKEDMLESERELSSPPLDIDEWRASFGADNSIADQELNLPTPGE